MEITFSGTSYYAEPVNWYAEQICQVMSGVSSLSTTVEITCILPKLSWKIDKEPINRSLFLKHLRVATSAIKLFKLHILLYVKNWATFHHFFHLSFSKVLYESVLFFIIKVLYKDVLLSIITCRHLLLTYHTQKVLYKSVLLSSKNVVLA